MPITNSECAATYKVVIVGDSGVGKSAILKCLMGKAWDERSRPTVGVDFVTKIVEADGALIELRVWDTAGLENFRSLTHRQFKGVQGVIMVYDVTNRKSFENVKYWLSAIPNVPAGKSTRFSSYEPVPFVVMANKADLVERKKVGIMEGMKLANKLMSFGFHETSAKTGRNIFTSFHNLAFTITDINQPKLMKSYHPHLIRPMRTSPSDDVTSTPTTSHPSKSPSRPWSDYGSTRPRSNRRRSARSFSVSLSPQKLFGGDYNPFKKKKKAPKIPKAKAKLRNKNALLSRGDSRQRSKSWACEQFLNPASTSSRNSSGTSGSNNNAFPKEDNDDDIIATCTRTGMLPTTGNGGGGGGGRGGGNGKREERKRSKFSIIFGSCFCRRRREKN